MTQILLIVTFIVLILLIFGMVKLSNSSDNKALKNGISVVLWLLSIFMGYKIYDSIQEPIRFDRLKEQRFQVAVNKLSDLKTVQIAYKSIKGHYTDNMDSIIHFIENEKFVIVERRDTSVIDVERNRLFGLSVGPDGVGGYFKDVVETKVIGKISVKDSLFKDSDRYKRLHIVRVDGQEAKVEMKADLIPKNEINVPVFRAIIKKADLLKDQNQDLVEKEKNVISVDGINGEFIQLGSLEEVNLSGNWPKKYGNNE
jgi:hypothetical protein